ncbi:excinuclease ABC subunit A [Candidatus Gottesmanbacteria bacterium RIFCSPLOWO2_02_FULL_42_29]|uniref:UvrABC system protein A n=2 Tax=Candidatus Gottesmaniibacteriota TaxID=1752720 RepID=A0A1F6BAB8_9BACT|nr:MAG: Excinuclease ABC, A subunit [Candidatus Gottesmanbacteria bacterium GW2011_GWA2_42_18]OGG10061.1 MAG: excinuclease ABC subunit A [Candidatus Gottesmanbacteria bacterium RIFCSPHIGHO2_01_FULL_42_27]OGG20320.1 MAG: excinuclease ABC subunit A [Candidatus Gottesmanbacteria bacterium RIFCSPHIGHO2_12_FULL_43_26]OGG33291.1 MAG: excinuclease ABC subunit A [Candidatus Gottesmanbacteria bacterium RIFCSPLOWO2_12_FULL_42_10]OGG33457.1 MAG: excinuclease ABC subunit A [Candidatus Gottesmanbacteria bac
MNEVISIKGAREHNLKNISLDIPKNKLIVFTGVSGSGKSSLAFDTIYAEGQRRYVESLSSYARQFLGVMDKPDVDSIDGLSPAISIDQKTTSHNPRSTVGTITEIYDYLRLLFARIGHPHCPTCKREVIRQTIQQIAENALSMAKNIYAHGLKGPGVRLMILSPVVRDRKGEFSKLFGNLRSKGFTSWRIDGTFYDAADDFVLIKTNKHTIDVVIDRIVIDKKTIKENSAKLLKRLSESIEQAVLLSQGLVLISEIEDASFGFPEKPKKWQDHLFSEKFACPFCNISLPELEPRMFSFNSPHGACANCTGLGHLLKVDPNLVVNLNLSISEGAIIPFAKLILADTWYGRIVTEVAQSLAIDMRKPLRSADPKKLDKLLYGTGGEIYEVKGENRQGRVVTIVETFSGLVLELERRYHETESDYVRSEIGKFLKEELCPGCQGKRLKPEALSVSIDGKSIVEVTAMPISNAFQWTDSLSLKLNSREEAIGKLILKELKTRISFLISVGLDYLTLDRSAQSLAGGEGQRIRLASQIGSGLTGVLYVLDEPSIGLHARDNLRLIRTLEKLRNLGNTVVVVEHDAEMISHADKIFDFGPAAGEHGGYIVAAGDVDVIKKNSKSVTGQYLSGRKKISRNLNIINPSQKSNRLIIYGCRENNLKNLNVEFPLQKLICVTGVSGSGKSTLVVDTLYRALYRHFNPFSREKIGKHEKIEGLEHVKKIVLIDQSPIGRTPRSNPATYTGCFSYIRELFAQTPEARVRGYRPGRFSFNVKGGRCEVCQGDGQTKIEMQFLPDVYITCDVCRGSRYNNETLEIRYRDKNIADVLRMTVEEALSYFSNIPGLYTKMQTLNDVGLSYIRLGQPAPHLSGGEAQRVKLASELSKRNTRETIFILDEPTTGLHFADLEKLLHVLAQLVILGNTVVIIEHNPDIIKNADWIIDLGPEGGDRGGEIVASGSPEDMASVKSSYTGEILKKLSSNKP